MSAADAKRFIDDVAKDKGLAERVKPHAAGLAALTAGAKAHGYSFTVDELKQAMRDKSTRELNDTQLDAIAGGSGGQPAVAVNANVQAQAVTNINVAIIDFVQTNVTTGGIVVALVA